jgi:hypothetical protein
MWPTILIAAVVAAAFTAVVVRGVINKKSGKHSCSCGGSCGTCGMNCHRAGGNQ